MTKLIKQPMCVRCRYYQPSNAFANHGECRAGLPEQTGELFGGHGAAREGTWPIVQDADWCGSYVPRARSGKDHARG